MKKIIYSSLILLAVLSSCMVGQKYTRPEISSPQSWMEQNKYINTPDSIQRLKWFQIFDDEVLNGLIDLALKNNFNLSNAALRIEQARTSYGITKAGLLPTVGYTAGAEISSASPNSFNILATASWEIDFWGKLRHAKKAAYAEILASEEGYKSVTTTLISDVASYYFQMRDLDNRLQIAERTLKTRTEYYNLVNARFKGGDVSELDMLQADQQQSIAMATINSLKRQINGIERSLNILLGQTPQLIKRGKENIDQQVIPVVPAGLPSDLLEQRPDVKQAEFYLIAETERIGVAQAMRFPSVSLTGVLGVASTDLSKLLTENALLGNASAGILGPIFAFGANKRRVELQKYNAEIAANKYLNTYFAALGEVENALVSVQTYAGEYDARKRLAEAAVKSLMLSQERYKSGYTDYLEVLIAESAMLESELQASATKAQQLTSYIYLYRALGGGW